MAWQWVTKDYVNAIVRKRDVDNLTALVRHGHELAPEVRDYLARVIADLIDGKRKCASRGRPKKKSLESEKRRIREKVWDALKSQGHDVPIELTNGKSRILRGEHSMKVAVAAVAKELKCSETTVWNTWAGFDPLGYEWGREKLQHDFEMDMAHEYRREEALGSLQREFGNRADFTDEEIEERAQELDEQWSSEAAQFAEEAYYED
jgi:hypothetical protein